MPFSTLIDWVTNLIIAKNRFMKWIKLLLTFSHLVWNFQFMEMCTSGKACAFFIIIEKWQSMCALHHKWVILGLKLRGQGVGVHHKRVFSAYVIVGGKKASLTHMWNKGGASRCLHCNLGKHREDQKWFNEEREHPENGIWSKTRALDHGPNLSLEPEF